MCDDYAKLNNLYLKYYFPLPKIVQLVCSIGGDGYHIFIDVHFSFRQILIWEQD